MQPGDVGGAPWKGLPLEQMSEHSAQEAEHPANPNGQVSPQKAEHRVASTTVAATIDQCFQVGSDISSYPEWIESLSSVEILATDESGLPVQVSFEASGFGRSTSYVLAYDFSDAPNRIGWSLIEGDLTKMIDGAYQFREAGDGESGPLTEVDYELIIDLTVPLPGFVKRRAEDRIMEAALRRFTRRVELVSGRSQPE